jgi:hypothetical protein
MAPPARNPPGPRSARRSDGLGSDIDGVIKYSSLRDEALGRLRSPADARRATDASSLRLIWSPRPLTSKN